MRIAIGPWGNPGEPRETLQDPWGPRCSPFAMPADKIKLREHRTDAADAADATDATDAPEVVSRTAARSPPPHAPGARMTVVTQTPSIQLEVRVTFHASSMVLTRVLEPIFSQQ